MDIPPINGLITVLAIVGAAYLIFKVASKLLKAVGLILIVALGWFFWQGGTVDDLKAKGTNVIFGKTPLMELNSRYCEGDKAEKTKCECFVTPVNDDLRERLSLAEIKAADADPAKRLEELRKSMRNQNKAIKDCLIKNKGAKGVNQMKEWINDL